MPIERDTIERIDKDRGLRPGVSIEPDPEAFIEVLSVIDGMHPDTPRDRLPQGSLILGENVRTRDGKLRRREGTTSYGGATEDEEVLNLIPFEDENVTKLIRITRARIAVDEGLGNWVTYTTGSFRKRFDYATFLDKVYVANGESKLREIDFINQTAESIEDAPVAKYVTNFAERTVAANAPGAPYTVYWPVNSDPTDWTGTGSGFEPLVSGTVGLGDAITGLFGYEDNMIILRENSIWVATRLPFADNPMRFEAAFKDFGCDLPHTARAVPGGIIFGNAQRRGVYFYALGSAPVELSYPSIRRHLFLDQVDNEFAQGAYDVEHDEYHIGEAYELDSPKMRRVWVYNRRANSWVKDPLPEITAMSWATTGMSTLFIDDLVGTIDAQVGFINELIDDVEIITDFFKANAGNVFYADDTAITDYNGADYLTDIQLPNFGQASRRLTLQDFGAMVESLQGCRVLVSASSDGITWRNELLKIVDASTQLQKLLYRRQRISGSNLYLRLQVYGGDFALESYWLRVLAKGQHR